jgi:uncharacterized membrane protein
VFPLIGHFHPVFVHLPIGILVLACIFQLVERRKPSPGLHHAITIALLIGMISAIISCITGYFLSRSDDYDQELVSQHQWMGIGVAVVAIVLYFLRKKDTAKRWHWPLMIVLIVLVSITGHIGGSLTHGSDYLTRPFTNLGNGADTVQRVVITDVQEAAVYQQVIQPLLETKCYSCHNKNKQKGGLRMDEQALLLKGGKNGVVLMPGKPDESDMLKRILLPREDEDHMPPKEKPQLTESEALLVRWWIEKGASFDKKVKELEQPAAVKPVLLALQNSSGAATKPSPAAIPTEPVDRADENALKKIRELGVVILPVSQNSHYLSANFITATKAGNKDLSLLLPVKQQLVWLKLGLPAMNDSALNIIAQCDHLTRLQLNHTSITDAGLSQLNTLKELRYLNLVGTKVSAEGLLQLKGLDKLQSIYCYQTAVRAADYTKLQKAFPGVQIDTGGYKVPLLETDTTEVKPSVKK